MGRNLLSAILKFHSHTPILALSIQTLALGSVLPPSTVFSSISLSDM